MARQRKHFGIETRALGELVVSPLPIDMVMQERALQGRDIGDAEGGVRLMWQVLRRTHPDQTPPDFEAWMAGELLDMWEIEPAVAGGDEGKAQPSD